jgi:hypothetical protein
MKKVVIGLLFSSALVAQASTRLSNVTIDRLGYDKNFPDVIFIRTSIPPSGQSRISCHTDNNWNYVLATTLPIEEKMFSAILAAQSTKQKLTLRGSGECGAFNTIEQLRIVYAE